MPSWSQRANELDRRDEAWRPPLFRPARTRLGRVQAAARRFLDLQAGSLWNDLAELLPGCRGVLLDVGCGAQPYRPLVSAEAVYRSIDTAAARSHFGYEMPDTAYYEGDVWPIADASIDVVLSTETLEHVPEPPVFLAEAFRCLKPGGTLILTVPFAARWHFLPHDYWRFTPSGLARLLGGAGFERIEVHARGNAVTVACYKLMALPLSWLLPSAASSLGQRLWQGLGLLLVPLVLVLAGVASLSLAAPGGADCLGYTVRAFRPGA